MKRFLWGILVGVMLSGLPAVGRAEPPVPEPGLRAEMDQRWEDAIAVYRDTLARDPGRTDLWLRIADIEARLGRKQEVVEALLNAIKTSPDDPALFSRLSQADAANGQPHKALVDINWALKLDPDNLEYLRNRAQLANWAGDPKLAARSYERILARKPEDTEALLGRARSLSWSGALDRAVCAYRAYLRKNPGDPEALLEFTRVQTWRGNYPAAMEILEEYRSRFGETDEYLRQKARLLAWAGRPTESLALVSGLLERSPEDYELNATRTLALNAGRRPGEAVESLGVLARLLPGSRETADIERFVRTPLRSNLNLGLTYYGDSDDIRIFRSELDGEWVLYPSTQLSAGAMYEELRADSGSGLERLDGGERIRDNSFWVGVRHRFIPGLAMDGRVGMWYIEDGNEFVLYRVGVDLQPLDGLSFRLERDRDLYAVSPRSVSAGVKRDANRLNLQWYPDLKYTLEVAGGYDTFSDDNRRWEAVVSPRRAVLRTEKFNLDLGLSAWWFGFAKDLDHGYYDPDTYQRYAVTGFGYWKINENNGLSLFAAVGVQKDESMGSFRDGEDVAAEGTFGIFSDWMLKARAGYTNRRVESGAFDGFSAGTALTRRF